MRTILTFAWKEILIALRDRKTAFIILVAPLIQFVIFGYVVTTEIKDLKIGYLDFDESPQSHEILKTLIPQDAFKIKRRFIRIQDGVRALEKGDIKILILIPPGLGSPHHPDGSTVQLLVDGSDANATRLMLSQLWPIMRHGMIKSRWGITLRTKVLFNPDLRSSIYMVPGVIVLVITLITTILTGVAVVRERERGTLEQILVSPLKPWHFILGKTLPFSLLAIFDVSVILPVAVLLFRLPIKGNLLHLFLATIFYILSTLALGLYASTISATQQQAIMTAFFFLMPLYLLSGLFFPVRSMPPIFQRIAFFNPLTHYLYIIRGILLKGSNMGDHLLSFAFLLVFGVVVLSFSVIQLRKSFLR